MSAKFHQISLKVLLYYCCGLRLSEGRLLKWKHMDLENGVLSIFGSKGRKDRLVYLPEDSIPCNRMHPRH